MCDSLSVCQRGVPRCLSETDKGEAAFIKHAAPGSEPPTTNDKQHVAVLWLTLPWGER